MSTEAAATSPGADLHRQEAELESAWQALQAAGHGYGGVRAVLGDAAGEGPDLEAAAAGEGPDLEAAAAAQQAFLERLDDFQRGMQIHFMDRVVRDVERAAGILDRFYGAHRHRRVRLAQRRIAALAERYRSLEPLYGTPQDHRRIAVAQRFYAAVVAFSRTIRRLDPTLPEPGPPGLGEELARAGRAVAWRLQRLPAVLRAVWAGVRLLAVVLARRQATAGTPFTKRIDDFFRRLGEVRGVRVEVTGHEHLTAAGGEVVSLYVPAHREGTTDNITFSRLDLPDYCVFNAVDQLPGVPRFLRDRAAATRGLIAVGGGRGPAIERALEAIRAGVSRNLLIYPEGSVAEGFRGTRPPRARFGEGLVERLCAEGLRVRLVPVTYLDNARFLGLPPLSAAPGQRRLRVEVSPGLEPDGVEALLAAGGGAAVNRMVRLAWLERLVTDGELFLGHDRVAAVEARLDRELDGIRYWGSLESVPVSDVLETGTDEPVGVGEEPFFGKRVRVLRLPDAARGSDGRLALPGLAAPGSRELLLGIRKPAHIYLNVGRRRFDGDIFRPLRVKERTRIFPGIVIRFLGVPVRSLNAIERNLERLAGREYRTLTCANSATRLIARAANLQIDDASDTRPFLPSHVLPTRTIRKLIEHGVRDHRGERVEIQIYKTDDRSLEAILGEARREELRIARDHLELLGKGAWRAITGVARGSRQG